MSDIRVFLQRKILKPRRLDEPDGRLLYQYECTDRSFWQLVDLLRDCGPPKGHDFDEYRKRFSEGQNTSRMSILNWTIRGFVLYASEFWRRFEKEEWQRGHFPDQLPFRKLTWLQFLSLIDWTKLYQEKIVGYITLGDTHYRVAHTSKRHAEESDWRQLEDHNRRFDRTDIAKTENYPCLYIPMKAAWNWWKVAPVRLPSSTRYLDTFALQGGAKDRLVVECKVAYETNSEVVYRPVRPPNGYGIKALPLERKELHMVDDYSDLNITFLFGRPDGPGSV